MSVFKRFYRFLRSLVGMEESIDSIMKPISTIVTKLEVYREDQLAAAKADELAASKALQRASDERKLADEADRLRRRYAA